METAVDKYGFVEQLRSDTKQFRDCYKASLEAIEHGHGILTDESFVKKDGWKIEQENTETQTCIYSKSLPKLGKVFVVVSEFDKVLDALFDIVYGKCEETPTWNPTVAEYKKILDIGKNTDLVYSRCPDAFGGLVKSREFIEARTWRKIGDAYVVAGKTIDCESAPKAVKGVVRGETLLGTMMLEPAPGKTQSTRLTWLNCADLKGMLPRSLVDRSVSHVFMEYTVHLRKRLSAVENAA